MGGKGECTLTGYTHQLVASYTGSSFHEHKASQTYGDPIAVYYLYNLESYLHRILLHLHRKPI